MKIILAQGNPEKRYDGTRHNVGFFVVDELAAAWGVTFKPASKFHADIAEYTASHDKVLLVKPTTYYNETGRTARALLDFYKLNPADFLIVHDDLALPLGTIRTRIGGSDAGNNGVKSITQAIGPDTARLRIGIWNDLRDRMDDADFVLAKFTHDDQALLHDKLPTIHALIDSFIADHFALSTHK